MTEKELLYRILQVQFGDSDWNYTPSIPLFSFEGLPGAGKTTQIELTAQALEKTMGAGSCAYIEIPTASGVGRVLKAAYSNPENWEVLRRELPWLNPLFLTVNLLRALQQAEREGCRFALMSRGLLSTYYYNADAYEPPEKALEYIQQDLKSFPMPSAVFFLELSPEEAHRRVQKRARGQLRVMDTVEAMRRDRQIFENYIALLPPSVPVYRIDASQTPEQVTACIQAEILKYLGE